MNPQSNTTTSTSSREAALTGLAIVGFVALVAAGMYLAVYSSRYVPTAVSRIGAAAVSLSSVFKGGGGSSLTVIPNDNSSTTISFGGGATTTPSPSGSTPVPTYTPVTPTAGQQTDSTVQISGSTSTPATLYGLPDLTTQITAVGYLTTNDTNSFVVATSVPPGMRPAVKFTVKNIGTNIAGPWHFSASIPTQSTFVYTSSNQQALNPGDSIDYTLGFDQPRPGFQSISVTANYDNFISESNTSNNNAVANVTIQQ